MSLYSDTGDFYSTFASDAKTVFEVQSFTSLLGEK